MRLKPRNKLQARNPVALSPLLHKSGVHEKDDVDIARQRERRNTRQTLKHTDWFELDDAESMAKFD
ncbi:MAG: hypothetical protein VXW65_05650 [Pseudomonadota bacterium]|nr:hypothetical protein [Pseudomonadota bacterium]